MKDAATTARTASHHATSIVVTLMAVLAAGCGPDAGTARGTAESFLDAHYVAIDLDRSITFTAGLARHKVQEEMRLTQGVEIDESTRKPVIRYQLVEERPNGEDAAQYLYEASISPEDVETFHRRWLLTVRREPDGWRVTNYEEYPE